MQHVTINELSSVLAGALGLDTLEVRRVARHLFTGGDRMGALHAARLLTAVLGTSRPIDATAVVAAMERLTATGAPHRTFVADLAALIEDAAGGSISQVPAEISIIRDAAVPMAVVCFRPMRHIIRDLSEAAGALTIYRGATHAAARPQMRVAATCPGSVIQLLGDALMGRLETQLPAGTNVTEVESAAATAAIRRLHGPTRGMPAA